MAATSTSAPYPPTPIVLPGIHELFPEHPFQYSPKPRIPFLLIRRPKERSASPLVDAFRANPPLAHQYGATAHQGCCGDKQWPWQGSSLRIHVNTHTGAQSFLCPYPGCGRAFNVNSNMRRHFRNHSDPTDALVSIPSAIVNHSVFTSDFASTSTSCTSDSLNDPPSYALRHVHPPSIPHTRSPRYLRGSPHEQPWSSASSASPPSVSWSLLSRSLRPSPGSGFKSSHFSHHHHHTAPRVFGANTNLRHPPSIWRDAVAYLKTDPLSKGILMRGLRTCGYSESDVPSGPA
ncbi:hypothetical protein C8F04DRAFT_149462 [Mycena alexandri]|uniref:C2H2-type domain-containing protein n=1 Tax=Mycena alexandri TaxID=1745969 RepID=A0AAD6SCV1_9AGAR|nr:hypothetical protein C8F04DRAFT_149462 [Mycena alexandri]